MTRAERTHRMYECAYDKYADCVRAIIERHTISTEIGDLALISIVEMASECDMARCDVAATLAIMQERKEVEKFRPHGVWRLT